MIELDIDRELLKKYDVPAPRYTSYPTVPYWSNQPSWEDWLAALGEGLVPEDASWSLYIHIPFCESLCTYCGCNTIITGDHSREKNYRELVLMEWARYLELAPGLGKRKLKHLHLGGGTPTFFSAAELKALIAPILDRVKIGEQFEGSIEVDPRRTRDDQLAVLRELGFNRISLGVQDFEYEVQRHVNRIQPFEVTQRLTESARRMGYDSVNYDLIYGLPKQTPDSIERTARLTTELRPDRIAFYGMAIIPWIKPAQKLFKDEDLPKGADKRELYERARNILVAAGYRDIGMDHFALETDSLFKAAQSGKLHRNFMGYSDQRTDVLLGLGVGAISEAARCFHQNEKALPVYSRRVEQGEVPTLRGHLLTPSDRQHREQILQFMTQGVTQLKDQAQLDDIREFLAEPIHDGIVEFKGLEMRLTAKGKPFLRNAAMALDERLRREKPQTRTFSQAL